jgi:hypothetical protein
MKKNRYKTEKSSRHKYFGLIIIVILPFKLHAQNISSSDNDRPANTASEKQIIQKLFSMNRETYSRQVFKVNFFDFAKITPNIGYEHRIGKCFSSDTYIKSRIYGQGGMFILDPIYRSPREFSPNVNIEENLKFYHNYKRRLEKGKNISGFSGNYLAVFSFINFNNSRSNYYQDNLFADQEPYFAVGLKYGIQRRIGNFGFIDAFFGIQNYTTSAFNSVDDRTIQKNDLILGVRAGFALESIKDIKRLF